MKMLLGFPPKVLFDKAEKVESISYIFNQRE